MSIFKDSFLPIIRDQIITRQEAIGNRTIQSMAYYTSRNAWIRMSSSVNVNGTDDLAKKYILQGGILDTSGKLRKGLDGNDASYSNISPSGLPYGVINGRPATAGAAGIRPMPGIVSIEVKSKGAYGSLREVIVNFKAWSLQQLEDLELLYMRPGYSVLLEWGWSPHLDNKGNLINTIEYYDGVIEKPQSKEKIYKQLFAKSTDGNYLDDNGKINNLTGHSGNYDAMFGFVKNYSWVGRSDGGYDCTTTIISLGEIIESLKINYSPLNSSKTISGGILASKMQQNGDKDINISKINISGSYSQNILAGLFTELYSIGIQKTYGTGTGGTLKENTTNDFGSNVQIIDPNNPSYVYDLFHKTINLKSSTVSYTGDGSIGQSDEQVYIRLESLIDILNNYVLLKDTNSNKPLVELSVKEREYDFSSKNLSKKEKIQQNFSKINNLFGFNLTKEQLNKEAQKNSGDGYLLSLSHPLTLSTDPSVCIIKNKLWTTGLNINLIQNNENQNNGDPIVKYDDNDYTYVITSIFELSEKNDIEGLVQLFIGNNLNNNENGLKELNKQFILSNGSSQTLGNYFNQNLNKGSKEQNKISIGRILTGKSEKEIKDIIESESFGGVYNNDIQKYRKFIDENPQQIDKEELDRKKTSIDNTVKTARKNLAFLDNIQYPYFINDDYKEEIGIIGNIYVNLNMLYNLSINTNLASQDKKEKNDISLYDFIKSFLSKISTSLGEVNNFDLHIDPIDNKARIIDINYVDTKKQEEVYNKTFEFQANLKSIIRSYRLESQIFPEQSTIIAIGAQSGGGALGTDTSTLVDFNKNIVDRIIPNKNAPTTEITSGSNNIKIDDLCKSLGTLYTYFSDLKYDADKDASFNIDEASKYENSLKDIINFFRTISDSNTKNRAIIPTKLSLEIDGIGGLVIGHLFRLPSDLLPKGYKGDVEGGINSVGSKLGYIITGINHSVQNNDWVTKIEAQTIILDNPTGEKILWENLIISPVSGNGVNINIQTDIQGNVVKSNINKNTIENFGKVDSSIPAYGAAILDTIAYTEGVLKVGKNNGYDIIVGYKTIPNWNENYNQSHPKISINIPGIGKSSASGRYQFLYDTWIENGGGDFNKKNQDRNGFTYVKKRIIGGENILKLSYNSAINGAQYNENEYFLKMLGDGKKGLAGSWASLPDRNGIYQYNNQKPIGQTIQDVYNVYLEAIKKYNT